MTVTDCWLLGLPARPFTAITLHGSNPDNVSLSSGSYATSEAEQLSQIHAQNIQDYGNRIEELELKTMRARSNAKWMKRSLDSLVMEAHVVTWAEIERIAPMLEGQV